MTREAIDPKYADLYPALLRRLEDQDVSDPRRVLSASELKFFLPMEAVTLIEMEGAISLLIGSAACYLEETLEQCESIGAAQFSAKLRRLVDEVTPPGPARYSVDDLSEDQLDLLSDQWDVLDDQCDEVYRAVASYLKDQGDALLPG